MIKSEIKFTYTTLIFKTLKLQRAPVHVQHVLYQMFPKKLEQVRKRCH